MKTAPNDTRYPTFSDFASAFKTMLVRRYNWNVDNAAQFDTTQIEQHYDDGKDIYETYFTLFNVEQDLSRP